MSWVPIYEHGVPVRMAWVDTIAELEEARDRDGARFDAAASRGDLPEMDRLMARIRVFSEAIADLCDSPRDGMT